MAGLRGWGSARFPEAVILPVQPYWVVVTARNGAGVWLARDAAGKLQVGPTDDDGKTSAADGTLDGLEGLHRLLERPVEQPNGGGGGGGSGGGGGGGGGGTTPPPPPLAITVGETALQPVATTGARVGADVSAALNTVLATAPGTAPLVPVTVGVATAVAGLVTVYPPSIEYTIL